jgi:cytochrome c
MDRDKFLVISKAAVGLLFLLINLTACGLWVPERRDVPDGDPRRGRQALEENGCGYCHYIPGVDDADGKIAMPLDDWGDRQLIAGQFPNTVENMIPWIQNPQAMLPNTTMPNIAVTEQEARDMTAYLFSLRQADPLTELISSVRWIVEDIFTDPPPTPQPPPLPDPQEPIRGWELYSRHCAECHRFFGEGVSGSTPALDNNPFVTGDPEHVIEVVLHGIRGMPAFRDVLNETEIAAIVSYIRTAWSNHAFPIEAEQVHLENENR